MAGVKGRSGGNRAGAGRPSKADKYPQVLRAVDDRLAEGLPDRIDTVEMLAEGGFAVYTETWQAAATVRVDAYDPVLDEDGQPTGKTTKRRVPAFPDKPGDELVLVKKVGGLAPPSFAANVYLIDRLAGRPTSQEEPEEEETESEYDFSKLPAEDLNVIIPILRKARRNPGTPPSSGS